MLDNITIVLSGHNQETALREVVHICLGVKISVSKTIPADNFVVSSAEISPGFISVKTEVSYGGKWGENIYSHKINEKKTPSQNMTNAVKTGFYRLFTQVYGKTLPWGSQTGIRPALLAIRHFEEGKTAEECTKSLIDEFSISPEKAALATEVAINETEILKAYPKRGVSVYIGIPFCPTRCLYCSFVSLPLTKQKNILSPYVDALCKEVEFTGKVLREKGITVDTIYIGGGTPTTLSAPLLKKLMESVNNSFDMGNLYEYTIEAGRADTITEEKLETILKYSSPNIRISINPQSLNNSVLSAIGRAHTGEDFGKAFSLARNLGFKNINCDLIAGLPTETPEMFVSSLKRLCALSPENITVHTMCVKRAASLNSSLLDDEASLIAVKMVDSGSKILRDEGYFPYYMYRQKDTLGGLENTGFTKKGFPCLYNIFMMEDVSTVIGLGAGASSKILHPQNGRIDRVYNYKDPWEYIKNFDEVLRRKEFIFNL